MYVLLAVQFIFSVTTFKKTAFLVSLISPVMAQTTSL